jgi:hypothetical protein
VGTPIAAEDVTGAARSTTAKKNKQERTRMISTTCRSLIVIAQALALCACSAAHDASQANAPAAAQQPGQAPAAGSAPATGPAAASAPASAAAPAGTGGAAMREFIDPATGQTREPTAADLKAFEAAKAQAPSAAPTVKPRGGEITLPNGMVVIEAPPPSDIKGCLRKDGTVVIDHECTSTAPAAGKKP